MKHFTKRTVATHYVIVHRRDRKLIFRGTEAEIQKIRANEVKNNAFASPIKPIVNVVRV